MCGIAGVVVRSGVLVERERLAKMTNHLTHRGPDGIGLWISDNGSVGLGHRRLSIIDLSALGAQPMVSQSGRYVITYNGEIYNFRELREVLEGAGYRFVGHSDTEVVLAAVELWGVRRSLPRLRGMFAFAIWDEQEQRLWLARDRIGIKPLYFAETPVGVVFASELRAIHAFGDTAQEISAHGLSAYLRYGYIPGPLTIFRGVTKLRPGACVSVSGGMVRETADYWNIDEVARRGAEEPVASGEAASVADLDLHLRQSVREHMVSDVPIGAFLSGGIDSSTVAALMQAESKDRIKTFSIGFAEQAYNEAGFAAAVAQHLGTDHTELYVGDDDAQQVIPQLPDIYDEPFADVSQIPTYLVARLAREQVKVALSGDGGDELFGGYNRYLFVSRFWKRLAIVPRPAREFLRRSMQRISPDRWDALFNAITRVVPLLSSPALPGQKMHKVAALLGARSLQELQDSVVSQWPLPHLIMRGECAVGPTPTMAELNAYVSDPVASQMLWDMHVYLVDDILTKVDRASMHVGLEARVPLLDHRVVEHAWRIPLSYKLRGGSGKWILRRVLEKYVPPQLFERPKMGFGIPIDDWLRGGLRDWAETLLSRERLEEGGHLRAGPVRDVWVQHLKGRINRGGALWTILMFQAWRERMQKWD
ncbi:MAG: hypothetical protein AMS22_00810 [Thiotrichales bacterium SG8_50]|nr:MAG: hypothetical protein AMS22_00810 [Thiotrichales bacterium SG8_50]